MKLTLALLTLLGLAATPLKAETTYYNLQLQGEGVEILYSNAYASTVETYPMELHWNGNSSNESFNFQLLCGANTLQSIWSRASSTYVRITIGADVASRCGTLPIRAKVTANSIPDLYLQILDYIPTNQPATTNPALGTSCKGFTRQLNLNEYESLSRVPYGSIGATCTSSGMTQQDLHCDQIREGNSCRLGRSCGSTPHGRTYTHTEGCKQIGLKVIYTSKCYDGTFSPPEENEVECNPVNPI